jgi:hypothetical protein
LLYIHHGFVVFRFADPKTTADLIIPPTTPWRTLETYALFHISAGWNALNRGGKASKKHYSSSFDPTLGLEDNSTIVALQVKTLSAPCCFGAVLGHYLIGQLASFRLGIDMSLLSRAR